MAYKNPITDFKEAARDMIESMTVLGGYQFDWNSAREWDEAKLTAWPSCYVECPGEDNGDYTNTGACQGSSINTVTMKITVFFRLDAEPIYRDDQEDMLLHCLVDLKKRFGEENRTLQDTCQDVKYVRYAKVRSLAGNKLQPFNLETYWNVVYQQSNTEPKNKV